jgi:hypothetical protein
MSTLVTARQKLESQQQENKGVQKVQGQILLKHLRADDADTVSGVQLTG